MKRKLFSLLVLLMTVVTGAWADPTIAKLWVGNSEEVTSEGTITGTGATEGTASVAIENGSMVLTLNNFKFIGCGHNDSGIYYQSNVNGNTPLIIKIEGNNEITLPGVAEKSLYGFYLYGGNGDHVFTITGSGSLTVTVGDGNFSCGIYVQQADLVLAGGTVTANAGSAGAEFNSLGVSVPQGTLTIDGCTLKASGSTTSASRGVNVMKNVTIKSGELEAYGYSKGIKNSDGGDALVFAEGVTPTLFKAGDNEASATDVSKYEGQKYLHVVCTGGDEPAAPTGDGVNFALSVGTNEHGTVTFKVGENTVTTAQEGQTVTVEITPATGWSTGGIQGLWHAAGTATKAPRTRRAPAAIDLLKDFELTPVSGNPNAFTFTMERANAEVSINYKKQMNHPDITIEDIADQTYTGQPLEPAVVVKDGATVLVKGTDYDVVYLDNTVAATATSEKAPAVIITACETSEKYSGGNSKTFTILPKSATSADITAAQDPAEQLIYNSEAQTPAVTVKDGSTVLTKGTDYTVTYVGVAPTEYAESATAPTAAGTYKAIITMTGNYTGTKEVPFTISPKSATSADITAAQDPSEQLIYNSAAQTPTIAVKDGSTVLAKGTDYTVTYVGVAPTDYAESATAPTAAGTYKAIITMTGNYTGTKEVPFTISPKSATSADITAAQDPSEQLIYNSEAQTPTVTVKDGSAVLTKGTDYTLTYVGVEPTVYEESATAPTNAGTYKAIITMTGNYTGTKEVPFTISPKSATSADITATQDPEEKLTYTSEALTPTVAVKDGEAVLTKGTDYTVTYVGVEPTVYEESATAPTNAGTYKAIITMTGNYTGTKEVEFTISPAKVTGVTLAQTEFMYNFDEPQPQTAQVAEVKAGNLIVPAEQYDVEGNTQTEPGEYTVTVTGKTNFTGTMTAKFVIKDTEVNGDAEKTETGEEVSDVKMTVSVVDRTQKTLSIDKFTKSSATSEGISIEIPAQINGWDVVNIGAGAMDGLANVTDIYMPDTEEPIEIGADALPGLAIIHTSLALLDDYALMASLKQNYEATKVLTTVTPANKYWTLGVGCDVVIPDGIDVYTVQAKNTAEVATEIIPEDLLKNGSERIIKSNNGVLLLGEAGQSYDLWAYSGRLASGMPVSTADNKDYGRSNCLEPVVEKKHYDSGHYFVLKNNEFHSILAEGNEVKVPAGRAVLHLGNDQAGARSQILKIDSEATGIESLTPALFKGEGVIYDLNGRKVNGQSSMVNGQLKKGIYILNGRKVVVK